MNDLDKKSKIIMGFIALSFHLNSKNIKILFSSLNVKVVRDELKYWTILPQFKDYCL